MPEPTFLARPLCTFWVQSNLFTSLSSLTSPNSLSTHTLSTVMVLVRANVGICFVSAVLAQFVFTSSWGSVWITLFQSYYLLLQRAQISFSSLDYVLVFLNQAIRIFTQCPTHYNTPGSGLGTRGHNYATVPEKQGRLHFCFNWMTISFFKYMCYVET